MHVVHIYKDYFPVFGGIENHVRVLAEGLARRNHRVTVLVTSRTPRDEIIRDGNLTIIKAARNVHLASTPLSLSMLRHARAIRDADIIHLHFPYPPADIAAALVPNHPPLVITYHSDIVKQRTLRLIYAPIQRASMTHAAAILPTSPQYIESSPWLRAFREKCHVVPLSVDPARFDQPNPAIMADVQKRFGAPLALFVGRLRYYKGVHYLLDAWKQLRTPAKLLIVGKGPEEQRLREQVVALGIENRVAFAGDVSDEDLASYYHAAQLFVLPSHLRSEAFGIVQLEAQAAGLPIVCTEIGTGTSYVTLHGQTGFVVPPADPTALAHALDTLLANPELAKRMGKAGRERAIQEFSHERLIERVEEIYRSLQPNA